MRILCGLMVVTLAALPALGNSLGLPNELVNGNFEEIGAGWTMTGGAGYQFYGQWGVPYNPDPSNFNYAGVISSWGGDWGGPLGTIRQVVDESQFPGWLPNGTAKEIDLSFDWLLAAHAADTWRNVGIKVYLDWQGDGSVIPTPGAPDYQRQLVFEQTRDAGNYWPGDIGWTTGQNVHVTLPFQPRYLSVEVEYYVHFAEWSFLGIDNVDLEARCIPEPATLGLLALGIPLIRRRRA
jgi:hypothetical protein